MKSVLLVGVGPLPSPERKRIYAPGLRLEAFLKALLRAGVKTYLAEISFAGIDDPFQATSIKGVCEHRHLGSPDDDLTASLNSYIQDIKPDAIVALTDIGALTAAKSSFTGPLHVDYFGHPMAERAQLALAFDNDVALADQWLSVLPVLLRADRFSACSRDQANALAGELGVAGRLNKATCDYRFVEIVPPTLPFDEPLEETNGDYLTEQGIPSDARVVLSTGGFNTWFDEETLFRGVEQAMLQDPRIHFVCTGGAIEGHVTDIYKRFVSRVEASEQRERFHLLGWIKHSDLSNVLLQSYVGVNCDRWTYEGAFGCRNRLYGWLWAGLRVVTTVTSEPTADLVAKSFVEPIPEGNPQALSKAIVAQCSQGRRENLPEFQQQLREHYSGEKFFQELTEWVRDPRPAPDATTKGEENPLRKLQSGFLNHAATAEENQRLRATALELADRLEGSRIIKIYNHLHPELQELIKKLREM